MFPKQAMRSTLKEINISFKHTEADLRKSLPGKFKAFFSLFQSNRPVLFLADHIFTRLG